MGNKITQFRVKHLIIIVSIIALSIIGGSGFIFLKYTIEKQNSTTQSPADLKIVNDDQLARDVSKWTVLDTKFFTMPIPDGWVLLKLVDEKSKDESGLVITPYGLEAKHALTYERGTKSVIGDINKPINNGFTSNFVIDYRIGRSRGLLENVGYTKDSSLKTNDGIEILKYYQNHTTLANNYFGNLVLSGTKEYVYVFNISEGIDVTVSYFIAPDDQDDNKRQLEQSIKSISIKKSDN